MIYLKSLGKVHGERGARWFWEWELVAVALMEQGRGCILLLPGSSWMMRWMICVVSSPTRAEWIGAGPSMAVAGGGILLNLSVGACDIHRQHHRSPQAIGRRPRPWLGEALGSRERRRRGSEVLSS